MYGHRLGLSGIDFTSVVQNNMAGGSQAQIDTLNRIANADTHNPPASDYGNVPAQYAGLVLHQDGSLGPGSDLVVPSTWGSASYWTNLLASNRYLILVDGNNHPIGSVGAIDAPAAAAVLATYAVVPGDTAGRSVATAATPGANAAAVQAQAAAAAASPVTTTAEPAAPAPSPTNNEPTGIVTSGGPLIDVETPPPGSGSDVTLEPAVGAAGAPTSLLSKIPTWGWIAAAAGLFLVMRRRRPSA